MEIQMTAPNIADMPWKMDYGAAASLLWRWGLHTRTVSAAPQEAPSQEQPERCRWSSERNTNQFTPNVFSSPDFAVLEKKKKNPEISLKPKYKVEFSGASVCAAVDIKFKTMQKMLNVINKMEIEIKMFSRLVVTYFSQVNSQQSTVQLWRDGVCHTSYYL